MADIGEGEAALGLILRDVQHGELVRLAIRDRVDHIESKVELILVLEGDLGGSTLFVGLELDELVVLAFLLLIIGGDDAVVLDLLAGFQLGDRLAGRIEDDGIEGAVPAADSDHAVGLVGVKVDRVAGA